MVQRLRRTYKNRLIDRSSFLSTTKWIEDVRSERSKEVIVVLVGNKADLSDKRYVPNNARVLHLTFAREVTSEEATAKATELDVLFMETSAKAGHNVKSLFKKIAMSLPGKEKEEKPEANTSKFWSHLFDRFVPLIVHAQKLRLRHQSQTKTRRDCNVAAERPSIFYGLSTVGPSQPVFCI